MEAYVSRLAARKAAFEKADQTAAQLGNLRLVLVIALLACIWYTQWWLLAATLVLFFLLGSRIQASNDAVARIKRSIAFYEESIDRCNGKWIGRGPSGESHRPASHLYANDLDLFGSGSLFDWICRARTHVGESTLASWLLAPSPIEEVEARQQAVRELTPSLDLREDLAVIESGMARQIRASQLASWGDAPLSPLASLSRPLYRTLSFIGATAIIALGSDILGAELPFARIYYLLVGLLCGFVVWRFRIPTHEILGEAEGAAREVALLSAVLARIEKERFTSTRLTTLRAQLDVDGAPPSRRIAQLRRWMDMVDSRDHFLVRVLGIFVLYDLHLAFALEDWRKQSGAAMRRWINAVGEMEALSSLASFHFENPHTVFPILHAQGPLFAAKGLIHPLMPRAQAVPNDIEMGQPLQALVVSGSNMSGKSTLMRTVGINTVLALAGAPVTATRLELSCLAIGASIATHDSLQGNTSRFYAEILRLRDIMQQAAGPMPVLFLIDEVLSGTNSHDRRIGAAAIIKGLVERNAIGITSTHDLALTQIVTDLGARATNVHFEDQLIDGEMQFDYKMQPGVVTHSNAIALMRAIGLEV
jgi:hypothetical protein